MKKMQLDKDTVRKFANKRRSAFMRNKAKLQVLPPSIDGNGGQYLTVKEAEKMIKSGDYGFEVRT